MAILMPAVALARLMRADLLAGGVLLALGVALGGAAADWWTLPPLVQTWWPGALVLGGAFRSLTGRAWSAVALLLVGVLLFVVRFGALEGVWWDGLWAGLLGASGIAVLVAAARSGPHNAAGRLERVMVFGGATLRPRDVVRGGELVSLLGGLTADLSRARLPAEGATLRVTAVLGGIDVVVPPDWDIVVERRVSLGGVDAPPSGGPPGAPRLVVVATVLLGGVEITHKRGEK